jgi:hypothetical protein
MIGVKLQEEELKLSGWIEKQKVIITEGANRPAYQKQLKSILRNKVEMTQ